MSEVFTDDGKIRCPQCKEVQDVLAYKPLKNLLPEETAEIIKCRLCRYVFAPVPKFFNFPPDLVQNQPENL